MSFGAPLGLLALLSVPLLVGLYFLRRRQPPRRVSALFLWRSPDDRAEAGPRFERFSREVSLLLECLAAICAALFLADLRCGEPPSFVQTVAVIDTSLSMSARDLDGSTSIERALAHLETLAERESGRITLIASGVRPKVVGAPGMAVAELRREVLTADAPSHDLAPALALARELASGGRVRLYTDALPEELPDYVEAIGVGVPLGNVAFVGASRRERDGKSVVSLRAANFSSEPRRSTVRLLDDGGAPLREEVVELPAGGEGSLRVELSFPGAVTAVLPDDALTADNRVRLLPEPPLPLKIRIAANAAAAPIRRYLAADGRISEGEPADVSITAGLAASSAPWTVTIGAAGETRGFVGPFFADRSHRLLEDVDLEGAVWFAGANPPGRPLLTAGDTVLLSESAGPSFHLNVDLKRSNLHRLGAFPILLSNLFALRRDALPGFPRRNLLLGEELPVTLGGEGPWRLESMAGATELRGAGPLRLPPPPPGALRLLRDGELVAEASVLPISPDESDLRSRHSGQRPSAIGTGRTDATRGTHRSGWPIFAMLLLLCADWWLTGLGALQQRPERRRA